MIEHEITLTRAELQDEWDKSCRLVERLTQAVKTLAEERDLERNRVIELLEEVVYLRGAVSVAGHHCEIRKCQACGHAYSKGWTRPCGHDEDSPVEK